MAGAFRNSKGEGKASFAKNLSRKDMETFHEMLGEEVKNLSEYSTGLSRKAQRKIMSKAENLRKGGQITSEDKKDLKDIVQAMGVQRVDAKPEQPIQRVVNFITDESTQTPITSKNYTNYLNRVNLAYTPDITEDTSKATNPLANPDSLKEKNLGNIDKNDVKLPDMSNLPDMDIG